MAVVQIYFQSFFFKNTIIRCQFPIFLLFFLLFFYFSLLDLCGSGSTALCSGTFSVNSKGNSSHFACFIFYNPLLENYTRLCTTPGMWWEVAHWAMRPSAVAVVMGLSPTSPSEIMRSWSAIIHYRKSYLQNLHPPQFFFF